jgi:hypothetical protein
MNVFGLRDRAVMVAISATHRPRGDNEEAATQLKKNRGVSPDVLRNHY